jgi:putative ABC transport system ATP-binding protein
MPAHALATDLRAATRAPWRRPRPSVLRIALVALAVLAALAIAGGIAWRLRASSSAPPVHYETAATRRGAIAARVNANGTLSAIVTVQVGSQVSGRIESILVDFNDRVSKGQVVATIEPSLHRAALARARANAAVARAEIRRTTTQIELGERRVRRATDLAAEGLLSKNDLETAVAERDAARANLSAAEAGLARAAAELEQASLDLRHTTIVSPIDGIVVSRNVHVGQTVAATLQAPTLFTIAQDQRGGGGRPPARRAGGGRGLLPAMSAEEPREPPVVDARGLVKVYRLGGTEVRALDGVDIRVERGESIAIMGASGSGKSTLMNVLGCLDRPDAGSYALAGVEVAHLSRGELATVRNRFMGFVFQSFNLLPRSTALENVELPLIYAGLPRSERRARAEQALLRVDLADRMHHRPAELSGGQQQRVAIARAIVNEPELVFADEPTGNLDSRRSAEVMRLFDGLVASGLTVVFVTHELDVAAHAARVVVLRDGCIVSDGPSAAELARRGPRVA